MLRKKQKRRKTKNNSASETQIIPSMKPFSFEPTEIDTKTLSFSPTILFDIDDCLCVPASFPDVVELPLHLMQRFHCVLFTQSIDYRAQTPAHWHFFFPQWVNVLRRLVLHYQWRVWFFSCGSDARNDWVIQQFLQIHVFPGGEYADILSQNPTQFAIFGRSYLTQNDLSNSEKPSVASFNGRMKKDLLKIPAIQETGLSHFLLVDNDASVSIFPSQRAIYLGEMKGCSLSSLLERYVNFQTDDTWETILSTSEALLSAPFYVMGILEKCYQVMKKAETTTTLREALEVIQPLRNARDIWEILHPAQFVPPSPQSPLVSPFYTVGQDLLQGENKKRVCTTTKKKEKRSIEKIQHIL